MRVMRTVEEMRKACKASRVGLRTLGLVPTMGALHEGHLSLVRAAKKSCHSVAASIFVNPLQFGVGEDLERYPRTFEADCDLLCREGVELLFAPSAEEMYPVGVETVVEVSDVGSRLDGASRPGHFRGVATVVSKLFHVVAPDRAFFGQKDAAQVAVLKKMVRDLNLDVEIVVCPIVRDADGLALSSRNRMLSADERMQALALSRALHHVQQAIEVGVCDVGVLKGEMLRELAEVRVDYADIVDPETLLPVTDPCGALAAVAAWVGETRLIDNVLLEVVR